MVTLGLYCGAQTASKTLATFPNKVQRHGIPFLIDLGLQGHQTWLAGSLDLFPQNAPYGIIQRIQMWETWRSNGPRPVFCQIYFIRDWVALALCMWQDIVLLEYKVALRVCSIQPVPERPYVDHASDTWAQRRSTTLTCFGNCEELATFRQKLLKENK